MVGFPTCKEPPPRWGGGGPPGRVELPDGSWAGLATPGPTADAVAVEVTVEEAVPRPPSLACSNGRANNAPRA
mgnify:CR=1 FL=1